MLLPSKHINFSSSLLGLGSYILSILQESPQSLDELWAKYNEDVEKGNYYVSHSLDNFILTIIFLYGINTVKEEKGIIFKCS